jgi:hypothetical protein
MPASRDFAAFQLRHRLAADENFARGRLQHAGEDLDERGLAGAIVADQPEHLALVDVEIDPSERVNASEGFGDVAEFDQPLGHDVSPPLRSRRPRRAGGALCIDQRRPSLARPETAW